MRDQGDAAAQAPRDPAARLERASRHEEMLRVHLGAMAYREHQSAGGPAATVEPGTEPEPAAGAGRVAGVERTTPGHPEGRPAAPMRVRFVAGESYTVQVRGHVLVVDQPIEDGGLNGAPTPTELFVAALAACVAYYAGRYLTRHGADREGLGVDVEYDMATRPARVEAVRLTLTVPASLPPQRWPALRAVASHCTVDNSLVDQVQITLAGTG